MNVTSRRAMKTAVCAFTVAIALNGVAIAAPTGLQRQASFAQAPNAAAHKFNVVHTFSGVDGSSPVGNLDLAVSAQNYSVIRTLYGETEAGGSSLSGTIYSYSVGTNAFASLYSFTGGNDGASPVQGLANNESQYFLAGSIQGGVTFTGGMYNQGTVFAYGANRRPVVVHAFTGGIDGGSPAGRITRFIDGNYYGTTSGGGLGFGTIFRVTPSGRFSTIYSFTGGSDGASPRAGLALRIDLDGDANIARGSSVDAMAERMATSENKRYVSQYLYGVTSGGGTSGSGTIFRINAAGKLQTLHGFSGGNDGGVPAAKLSTDLDGNLYGTTTVGGSGGNGVVFKIPHGREKPRVIYDFGNGATGASPAAQITLAFNGNLYGTTTAGGASGEFGTVFEITSGGVFSDIHDFAGTDGGTPLSALLDGGDNKLYGTTTNGGAMSAGVLFSIAE